jgi:electron transfer flavoprotein beta subunit
MKIVVPIKQILDPSGITVRRDKERIFVNREEYIIGPGSKAAIEAGLQLRDAGGMDSSGEPVHAVVTMSMGESQAEDALREAMAMGCDAAYLLSDEAFKDADISVTARILASAIEKFGGADLIVVGRQSGDTGAGQIGPRLAEALRCAQVTDVYALSAANGSLEATRRWDEGYAAVQVAFPAVVSVAPEAFAPRYAHGARIMNAYQQWDVVEWSAADLDLSAEDLEPLLSFRGQSFPPPVEVGEEFRGDPASVAQDVVMTLKQQKLLS